MEAATLAIDASRQGNSVAFNADFDRGGIALEPEFSAVGSPEPEHG